MRKKLILSTETLRQLTPEELVRAPGGWFPSDSCTKPTGINCCFIDTFSDCNLSRCICD